MMHQDAGANQNKEGHSRVYDTERSRWECEAIFWPLKKKKKSQVTVVLSAVLEAFFCIVINEEYTFRAHGIF